MSAPSTTSAGFGNRPRNQHSNDQDVATEKASTQPNRQLREGFGGDAGKVASRHVICFVLLAYGIAWAIWVTQLGPAIKNAMRDGRTPDNFAATPAVMLGMYAPALAAVVMRSSSTSRGSSSRWWMG